MSTSKKQLQKKENLIKRIKTKLNQLTSIIYVNTNKTSTLEQLVEKRNEEIHNLKTQLDSVGPKVEATTLEKWMEKLIQLEINLKDKDDQILSAQTQLLETLTKLQEKQREITD